MRRTIMLLIVISAIHLHPQVREIESRTYFKQGDFEFNLSSSLGAGFSKSTVTRESYNYYDSSYTKHTSEYSDRLFNLLFTASLEYWIFNGLSLEPELELNLITDAKTSISILANLSYTFNSSRNVYHFIKLGYGLSNYYPDNQYRYYYDTGSNALNTKVINASAGLKFLYSSSLAMRMEINYKNYSYSIYNSYDNLYYPNPNADTSEMKGDMDVISLSIGFSILI